MDQFLRTQYFGPQNLETPFQGPPIGNDIPGMGYQIGLVT